MVEITKSSSLGLKVKTSAGQNLIHGSIVSYLGERRTEATGEYGILDEVGAAPVFLWPGLNGSFGVDVDQLYEEISYNPVHATTNILELVRNAKIGEDLGFGLSVTPQKTGHFPLLKHITGSATALGDEPDSMSWLKELNGRYSLFTGIMFEDYKAEIPGIGVMKETFSGFAGNRLAVSGTNPGDAGTDASENDSRPIVWNDIASIKLDTHANPDADIQHCLSDISYGFTSEIKKEVHPESSLSTKIKGVRVVSRKMFVSLKLTWVDQTFLDVVTGSTKQYLKMVIGTSPDAQTLEFGGLYWPKYLAKAEPKELVGDTITCIVDQPVFAISAAS